MRAVVTEIRQLKSPTEGPKVSSRERDTVDEMRQHLIDNIWKSDWNPDTFDTDLTPSHLSQPVAQAIIRSLTFEGMNDRGDLVTVAYEKTFNWIFHRGDALTDGAAVPDNNRTGFVDWLEAEDTSIYWITGKPGSGKSTLVKYILAHPELPNLLKTWAGRRNVEPLVGGYYFWDAGSNPLQKSREGMMRTLLYQCLSQRVDIIPKITPRRWALHSVFGEEPFTPPQWTWEELNQVFALFTTRSGRDFRLSLFIDGLDEFDGNPRDIIALFESINLKRNVKICVASRPWTIFADALAENPSLTMQQLTQNDVITYVRGQFENCRAYHERKAAFPEAVATLIKDVVLRAEGVFLWVSVVVRSLKEDMEDGQSLNQLQTTLESLPEDINSLYTKIWQRIQQKGHPLSKQLLQIKMASIDIIPLDSSLMWIALGEALPESSSARESIKPILTRKLDNFTRGFLEISPSSSIEFMHRTASDWAKQSNIWKESGLSLKENAGFDPSLALLRAANVYITPRISERADKSVDRVGYIGVGYKFEDWTLISQVLTLAGNVADWPENVLQLTEILDEFDRIVAGESNPTQYSRSHWSVKATMYNDSISERGDNFISALKNPKYENCFVGVAASFAILPYVREKVSRHPELLRRNQHQHRLSLLESAICGWNRTYWPVYHEDERRETHDRLFQFCRGRRIEMIRFILGAGGCLETRAYLARPLIISIRDQAKRFHKRTRDDIVKDGVFAPDRWSYWGDALALIQSQPVSVIPLLPFQGLTVPLRIILLVDRHTLGKGREDYRPTRDRPFPSI